MTSIARTPIAGVSVAGIPIATANLPNRDEPFIFGSGATYNWSPTKAGLYKFVAWGPGGVGSNVPTYGASGGYFEITKYVRTTDVVVIVTGVVGSSNTTIAFPDGTVATATRANGSTPGSASGGDVNLAGSNGESSGLGTGGGTATTGQGAGAPANLPYRGGNGTTGQGLAPGGGGGDTAASTQGGGSLVIAALIRE